MLLTNKRMENQTNTHWEVGDKFTTPGTGDTVFTVSRLNKYDVEAADARSRAGFTIFSKSYITKVESVEKSLLEIRKEKLAKLKEAAKPLLKLLCEEYHPHHTIILTGTSFELLEGVCSEPKIFDYVVD